MPKSATIRSLATLRGIAVLAVCLCHFAKPAAAGTIFPHLFRWIENNGLYGVHIFFVISGFIIPYSLDTGQYELRQYFKFLEKRLVRLHPPYLVALTFTLLVAAASYRSRGIPNPENLSSILGSLFYLHVPADNPVFWTLRAEAEFYLFIGLFFPLLKKFTIPGLLLMMALAVLCSHHQSFSGLLLVKYLPFFLTGTSGYLIYIGHQNKILALIAMSAALSCTFVWYETQAAIAAALTIATILSVRKNISRVWEFTGEISYSLYLIHFPIGIKLINLMQRHLPPSYNWVMFLTAVIVTYLAAVIFWYIIEKPSANLSAKIRYKNSG